MNTLSDFEFSPRIEPTIENAQAMRSLTIQSLAAMGVKQPESVPPSPESQLARLIEQPEYYAGYTRLDGGLVGFSKTSPWFYGDQASFISRPEAVQLRLKSLFFGGKVQPLEYGIPALNVAETLDPEIRMEMFRHMLVHATEVALENDATSLNISLVANDELHGLIAEDGFVSTGMEGEVASIPGVQQTLFKKSMLDLDAYPR